MKMRAAVFYGKGDIRVEERELHPLGVGEVLIDVAYCGVCGTDLHIFHGDAGAAQVNPPTILGHEFSGIVSALGKKTGGLRIGDRVCVDPNNMCGSCCECRNGRAHFCRNVIGYGTTQDGGFAHQVMVHSKQVYRIQDSLSLEEAAMAETVSCCVHGIDLCHIEPGSTCLIIGGGPIGLMMLQLAKSAGAALVILSEPVLEKRELGLKLGADLVINPLETDLEKEIERLGIAVNTVIECVGSVRTIRQAMLCAGRGATVMMFGLTEPEAELVIKPFEVFQKELHLTASYINPYTFERALRILESGRINVRDIITDRVALEKIEEVFTQESYRKAGKILISI